MIFEKVQEIIAEHYELDEEEVSHETYFNDLGDSLDFLEILLAIEEEFEIEIPDDEAEEINRVQDLVEYIEANQ